MGRAPGVGLVATGIVNWKDGPFVGIECENVPISIRCAFRRKIGKGQRVSDYR